MAIKDIDILRVIFNNLPLLIQIRSSLYESYIKISRDLASPDDKFFGVILIC